MQSKQGVYPPAAEGQLSRRHLSPFSSFRLAYHLEAAQAVFGIILSFVVAAAIGQHICSCFSQGNWGFLLLGTILTPIGAINGFGIWLGLW